MKTVAIDIDDVLSMSARGLTTFSNEKWGTTLTEADFTEDLGAMWDVDHDEITRRLKVYFASDITKDFLPMPGAAMALGELALRYKLVLVTSRVEQMMPVTREWVDRNFEGVPFEIYGSGIWDKLEKDAHKQTKSQVCINLGADYLLDDQLKHCTAVSKCGIKAILFGNYAWNQADSLPKGVQRAENWQTVLDYFANVRD